MSVLNSLEKIKKAKIALNRDAPFFGYLTLHLNEVEEKSLETLGVDIDGNLYYNPSYIDSLTEQELKGCLCHEVLHLVLMHMQREKHRQHVIWNYATDIAVNAIVAKNGFILPATEFVVSEGDKWVATKNSFVIKNVSEKTAEIIYDELLKKFKLIRNKTVRVIGSHEKWGKKGKKGSSNAAGVSGKDWKKIATEAATRVKTMKGSIPSCMDRVISELLNPKINWKAVLYKYLTHSMPIDYTWSYPSKRSQSIGLYMPSLMKENIEITVAIDTSGSIDKDDLTEFVSEIIHIAKSFQSVKINVIEADCMVQNSYVLSNGRINAFKNIKCRGGGGTSHVPVFRYVQEKLPSTRLLVCFTDLYTSYPKNAPSYTVLWVASGNASRYDAPFGTTIRMHQQ